MECANATTREATKARRRGSFRGLCQALQAGRRRPGEVLVVRGPAAISWPAAGSQPPSDPTPAVAAARSRSMSTRRRILPEGDFGISSTISTARTFLYGATRSATNRVTSSGVIGPLGTTNAFGHLAGLLVGDRDHGRVGDRRVREQQRLQFGGGDLVALVLDQLLDPVDDPQRAVLARRVATSPVCSQPSGSIASAVA